jgi:CheY-like chemotaxis protein
MVSEPTNPTCVLLAEDDRSMRRYLQVVLERAGYQVIVAADGLEAIKLALSARVDIVVADSIMPHLGGPELCRLLRSNPKVKHLPVVLLTGLENLDQSVSNLFDACLTKPVDVADLHACLERLVGQSAQN